MMRKISNKGSYSLGALVDIAEELIYYHRQKTLYECRQEVLRIKQELAEVQYSSNAALQRELTVELQRCRYKLPGLRAAANAVEPECKVLFEELLSDLEKRVAYLTEKRKPQRPCHG
jgi:hypothetical protein